MEFNEFVPACGWIRFNRRRRIGEALRTVAFYGMCALLASCIVWGMCL